MNEVLVVIPARGGSKGIPRKNVRLLAGLPLIAHVIRASEAARLVTRVVVTTDDEEIAVISRRFGAEVIERPVALAGDAVTLDPVIYHAVTTLENNGYHPDIIITVQPTSPLLRPETIDRAVELLSKDPFDTVISVVNDTHLVWAKDTAGNYMPMYKERLNRQYLPPMYRETGAILATRRSVVTETGRIGPRVTLIELSQEEAIDIDGRFDWWLAEKTLSRRRIVLRTDGSPQIGLGHVYRCLSLAGRLLDHEVIFVMNGEMPLGTSLVERHHYPLIEIKNSALATIQDLHPDIVINDILDTSANYIQALREKGAFVVNLEDLGTGATEANMVINALYNNPVPLASQINGPEYDCLRDEFYTAPTKTIMPKVRRILLTFGGVDQSNLTSKVLRALDQVPGDFEVDVILGLGYAHYQALNSLLPQLHRHPHLYRNVQQISEFIYNADLAVTSAGRTVLEVAAIGTPGLVLAQNTREMRHLHARAEYGIVNLGLGKEVSETTLVTTLHDLIDSYPLRQEMNKKMLALNIRGGCKRIIDLILARYRAFEEEHTA